MQRQLTKRGQERRDQLVATATARFAAHGYHGTSVSDIVAACGVGKGVFYWYFESKEALFVAILEDSLERLRRTQRRAIEGIDDPIERIDAGIRASMDFLSENADLFRLMEFAATDANFADAMRRGIDIVVEDTTKHVKDAIVDGRIPDNDVYFLGHGITTITMHFFRNFLSGRDADAGTARSVDREAVINAAVDFCLHGIGL